MSTVRARPIRGLPGPLPDGERMLWQGAPDWRALARRALHTRKVATYFGVLVLWRLTTTLADGGSAAEALFSAAPLVLLAAAAFALLTLFAWLSARTTVYTITTRRLVIHCGVALPMTINFPFKMIESAGLKDHGDGTGDIAVKLPAGQRIAYLHLWPHARPWRYSSPEPMLRCIRNPKLIGELLARSLAEASGGQARAVPVAAREPSLPVSPPATAAA
jgi:hypothetical protein